MPSNTSAPASALSSLPHVTIRPERPGEDYAISKLCAAVFGPGANARAAAALREGVPHRIDLSYVAFIDSSIVGTCRLTPVVWAGTPILMLGPLGVARSHAGMGIGRGLMRACVQAADDAGEGMIFLVGDWAYYGPFGFHRTKPGRMTLPRPADAARVLLRERVDGLSNGLAGAVVRAF